MVLSPDILNASFDNTCTYTYKLSTLINLRKSTEKNTIQSPTDIFNYSPQQEHVLGTTHQNYFNVNENDGRTDI
jgi:hypothetical protein